MGAKQEHRILIEENRNSLRAPQALFLNSRLFPLQRRAEAECAIASEFVQSGTIKHACKIGFELLGSDDCNQVFWGLVPHPESSERRHDFDLADANGHSTAPSASVVEAVIFLLTARASMPPWFLQVGELSERELIRRVWGSQRSAWKRIEPLTSGTSTRMPRPRPRMHGAPPTSGPITRACNRSRASTIRTSCSG